MHTFRVVVTQLWIICAKWPFLFNYWTFWDLNDIIFFIPSLLLVDPPWNQTCHSEPDYQRTAGAAWMQLPLHCGFLWCLLQWRRDQHLYGAHGKRYKTANEINLQWGIRLMGLDCRTLPCTCTMECWILNVGTCLYRMEDHWTRSWKKPEECLRKSLEKLA